jgi:hypothetical protein
MKNSTGLGSLTPRRTGVGLEDTMDPISMKVNIRTTNLQATEGSSGAMEESIPVGGKTMLIMDKVLKSSQRVRPEKGSGA